MDTRYEEYCLADPLFYDSPAALPEERNFTVARMPVPEGWQRTDRHEWIVLTPQDAVVPSQGWKVHVSACLDNAERVLATVREYCLENGLAFKFLRSSLVMLSNNGKYAPRQSSGKLVTIYPADEARLEQVLTELGAALDGEPGPHVLSDLRWGDGPLYVRYGGFVIQYCRSPLGEQVPAIEDPSGNLVPDPRGPVFSTPDWVTVPGFLAPALTARAAAAMTSFPYTVTRALHFSNAGGVYLADGPDGQVVIKEARPHAGLDSTGTDAVTRLIREHEVLRQLDGSGVAPGVVDYLTCWEHHFLVLEYIEAVPLNTAMVSRYPLVHPEASDGALADYTQWALATADTVEVALRALHERGLVYGDLHPNNVLVKPDGSVALVDFEGARPVEEFRGQALGAAGFRAPRGQAGFAADLYPLACLRLWLFLPATELLNLDPGKAEEFIAAVQGRFPVPASFTDQIRTGLQLSAASPPPTGGLIARSPGWQAVHAGLAAGVTDWPALRASVTEGILATATPERGDRLFPGDLEQFRPWGGLCLAYGAAGVLLALHEAGAARFPEHERWLVTAAMREQPHGGLYTGAHGVAYALERLGLAAEAANLIDELLPAGYGDFDLSLHSGTAGAGLAFLHFARVTGDTACHDAAVAAASRLACWLGDLRGSPPGEALRLVGHRPGLMRGASGAALLFIQLYERTGDTGLLDLAEAALRVDLDRCVTVEDGTLQTDDGMRVLPYIAAGSAGIGLVLRDYLAHRPGSGLADQMAAITRAAEPEAIAQAGLFMGRAGLLAFLARERDRTGTEPDRRDHLDRAVRRHTRLLSWHALPYRGYLAFPGDQLARLSTDMATGAAGILLALHAARTGAPALPLVAGAITETAIVSRPQPAYSPGGRPLPPGVRR